MGVFGNNVLILLDIHIGYLIGCGILIIWEIFFIVPTLEIRDGWYKI